MAVVTRFAPSPTGRLHAGNARTALYNWLFARGQGGRFVLRSEDTDAERSREAHLPAILEDLAWLGLDWDAGPDRQSERAGLYREQLGRLAEAGRAYACWRTEEELAEGRAWQRAQGLPPRYDRAWAVLPADEVARRRAAGQRSVIRFRAPDRGEIRWDDLVRGERRLPATEVGDFPLTRGDGSATFLLANAVDDALMGITHVLRGEDHLANTGRQIALLQALDLPVPRYGHLPLLAGPDGGRLSKRDGARGLADWRAEAVLPVAAANYLARLGYAWPQDRLLSLDELAEGFDVTRVSTSRARLDEGQLRHWQHLALAGLDEAAFAAWAGEALAAVPPSARGAFVAAVRPNVETPAQVAEWAGIVYGTDPGVPVVAPEASPALYHSLLAAWGRHGPDPKALAAEVRAATGAKGRGFFHPLRLALTGREDGPEMGALLALIPADTVKARLERCLED